MASISTTSSSTQPRLKLWQRLSFEETMFGWIFILPAVLGLILFQLGPVLVSMGLSFTEYDIINRPTWTGLENYTRLFQDDLWIKSIQVTLKYVVIYVPAALVFAYLVAILMSGRIRGISAWRTMWYLPSIVPSVAAAAVWRWGLHPEFGPINFPLKVLGLPAPRWLADPDWIVPSIVFISLWSLGNSVLIFLASITGVPRSFYEAAEVDGAGIWRQFTTITLPLTSSIIFFQLIITVINSFQVFTSAFILFGSNAAGSVAGPGNAALFYMLYMYRNAFGYFRNGYASAMAWLLFLTVAILTFILFKTQNRWVYYEAGDDNE